MSKMTAMGAGLAAAKDATGKTINYLQSDQGKKVIKVAVVVIAAYIAYRLIKGVVVGTPNREEVQQAYNELDKLNQNSSTKQKITPYQAEAYANIIAAAIDGYGTDEQAIYNVFWKIQNNADYLAISAAYGIREVSSGAWNPEPNFKGTLTGSLTSELSADEKKVINDIFRKKKITYRV